MGVIINTILLDDDFLSEIQKSYNRQQKFPKFKIIKKGFEASRALTMLKHFQSIADITAAKMRFECGQDAIRYMYGMYKDVAILYHDFNVLGYDKPDINIPVRVLIGDNSVMFEVIEEDPVKRLTLNSELTINTECDIHINVNVYSHEAHKSIATEQLYLQPDDDQIMAFTKSRIINPILLVVYNTIVENPGRALSILNRYRYR